MHVQKYFRKIQHSFFVGVYTMWKMKAKPKKRERTSIRQLLASFKKVVPRKKTHTEAGYEYFIKSRIFGATILPTEKQYENIAAPFVKQR